MDWVEHKIRKFHLHGSTQQRFRMGVISQPMGLVPSSKDYKALPWLVGYRNSASIQGSPHALAARYGYNGTIRITAQCSDRTMYETLCKGNELMSAEKREWIPPLLAAPCGVTVGGKRCEGSYTSSPKLWPDTKTTKHMKAPCIPSTDLSKNKQLLRVMTRDEELWNEIATKAKEERKVNTSRKENVRNVNLRLRNRKTLEKKEQSGHGKIVMLR